MAAGASTKAVVTALAAVPIARSVFLEPDLYRPAPGSGSGMTSG
jgi:hypothetical protein